MHAQQHVVVVRRARRRPGARRRAASSSIRVARSGTSVPGRAHADPDLGATARAAGSRSLRTTSAGEPVTGGRIADRRPRRRSADRATAAARRGPSASRARASGCGQDAAHGARLLTSGSGSGRCPSGPTRSVVDVPGVGLGHATVVYDDAPPPVRPRDRAHRRHRASTSAATRGPRPVPAGVALLNGAGELTARSQIDEWGLLETPVFLTSTMQVGRVYDAACRLLMAEQPRIGVDDVIIPAVGECDDSWLNDPRHMHVTDEHVAAALGRARASAGSGVAPDQGAVGAGTGMSCFNWKGGIGTASRVLPDGHVLGVVLLTQLRPVGPAHDRAAWWSAVRSARPPTSHRRRPGSCLGVVVTDAPLDHSALRAARAAASGSGSRAPGRPRTTAAARSSSASALGLRAPRGEAPCRARRSPAAGSTPTSRRSSTPPRRRSSPRCSPRTTSPASRAAPSPRCPSTPYDDSSRRADPMTDPSDEPILPEQVDDGTPEDAGSEQDAGLAALDAQSRRTWSRRARRRGAILEGTKVDAWIPMSDGVVPRGHALPARTSRTGPQPCILEALPYRKDDMTSSYRPEYVRLRDEHALRRRAPRRARHGEQRRPRHRRVPRAGAARPRRGASPGSPRSRGATATSACTARRTAASTRCRWRASGRRSSRRSSRSTRPTTGTPTTSTTWAGCAKWIDLVDYCHYMTPMNALPPVPARLRARVARRVAGAHRRARAVAHDLDASTSDATPTGGTARCVRRTTGSSAR